MTSSSPQMSPYIVPDSRVEPTTQQKLPLVLTDDTGNAVTIEIRPDGYVNATKLCQALGKDWKNYFANAKSKEFLEELSKYEQMSVVYLPAGNPASTFPLRSLIELGKNQHQNTWVHPDVAINLAQWASARFGVAVSRLVRRYQTGQVTTSESIAASRVFASQVNIIDRDNLTSKPTEFRTKYENVPSGPKVYRRLSLANYIDGLNVQPKIKLRPSDMKIGINRTDLSQRDHGYKDDFGVFDRVITTETDKQAEAIEGALKAAIKPYVTQNSQEYFSPEALVKGKGFDSSKGNASDVAWAYGLAIAKSVEHSGITGIYDADVIIDEAAQQSQGDSSQKRVTDFFDASGKTGSTTQTKRDVTVRFKSRETDVALKRIDVELLKESASVEKEREREQTKRLEIDAGVERARIDQREIDASVEKAREETKRAAIEAEVERAREETKRMEIACRQMEAETAKLKEQTRQQEIELARMRLIVPPRPTPSKLSKLGEWFQTYTAPCTTGGIWLDDVRGSFCKYVGVKFTADHIFNKLTELGIRVTPDEKGVKCYRIEQRRFVLTKRDGVTLISDEAVRRWWFHECVRHGTVVGDNVLNQFIRRFDADDRGLAFSLAAIGIECSPQEFKLS